MSAIVFYKDSLNEFECDIKIDGASLSNSRARLLFEFGGAKSLLFNGSISDNGHIKFNIPKLNEIDDNDGTAILEVIADSTYFEAWKSPFELKKKKTVEVNEVFVNSEQKPTIVVENIQSEDKPIKKKNLLTESCSIKNKKFVTVAFKKFKSFKKSDKMLMEQKLDLFSPNEKVLTWGNSVFEDPESKYAKYCMYELQNIIDKS